MSINKIIYFNRNPSNSQKIRYKIIENILKLFTPNLYKKLETSIKLRKKYFDNNLLTTIPRPSIKEMKKHFNNKSIIGVEIGVRKGLNANSILNELNINKLFLIDSWLNEKNYYITLNKFYKNNKVIIIKKNSNIAINQFKNNSLDFVYIDGNHTFDFVYQDINLWFNKIKRNGIIAGHDVYVCQDVLIALREFCFKKKISYSVNYPDWYFYKH